MNSTDIYLLASTLLLGIRHGIDWDHIAAILDLTGASAIEQGGTLVVSRFNGRSAKLATSYAVGHAFVVVAVGLLMRAFASTMPGWFDHVAERIVGATLILFGALITIAIIGSAIANKGAAVQSRASLLATAIHHVVHLFTGKKNAHSHDVRPLASRRLPAFIIGMIHGIGAETSTQVILIASVAAASGTALVVAMLGSFTAGLILSSVVIAVLAATGFVGAASVRPLYTGVSILTSIFSIYVGYCLFAGVEGGLPSLTPFLNHIQLPSIARAVN